MLFGVLLIYTVCIFYFVTTINNINIFKPIPAELHLIDVKIYRNTGDDNFGLEPIYQYANFKCIAKDLITKPIYINSNDASINKPNYIQSLPQNIKIFKSTINNKICDSSKYDKTIAHIKTANMLLIIGFILIIIEIKLIHKYCISDNFYQ